MEWLNELPEPQRSRAIENTKNDKDYTGDTEQDSLSEALVQAFIWGDAPERWKYWGDVYDKIKEDEARSK